MDTNMDADIYVNEDDGVNKYIYTYTYIHMYLLFDSCIICMCGVVTCTNHTALHGTTFQRSK